MHSDNQVPFEVENYLAFVGLEDGDAESVAAQRMTCFLMGERDNGAKREIVYDRGSVMLLDDGRLVDNFQLHGTYREDRIVRFDGTTITEINPFQYLDDVVLEMKGDSSGSGRRRGGGVGGGVSCNNNNNNNNNNNG